MYERFTDRARKAMAEANVKAQSLGAQKIEPEHILLAIFIGGVGQNVLQNLDIRPQDVRDGIAVRLGQPAPGAKADPQKKISQSARAKKVIEWTFEEARALCHNYHGTEHLLLGILREGKGIACELLSSLGVTLEDTRQETLNLLGASMCRDDEELIPLPPGKDLGERLQLLQQYLERKGDAVEIVGMVVRKKTSSS